MTLIVKNETTMVDTGRMSRVTLHYSTKFLKKEDILSGNHSENLVTLRLSSLQVVIGKCVAFA